MSDNFLYSSLTEEGYTNMVTAEDLNNIAADLGYAEYSHFPEEPPQSAVSALNQITQDLTSKGILQIGNCCKVSINENTITVADGVCVFENGAKKRLTEPVTLAFIEGSVNYVYMLNNITENRIQVVTSINNPAESEYAIDYVMLAEISKSKAVKDRRYWSISKTGNGKNIVTEHTAEFKFVPEYYNASTGEYERRYTEYVFDISQSGANYLLFYKTSYLKSYPIAINLNREIDIFVMVDKLGHAMEITKEGTKLYMRSYSYHGNKANSLPTEYETKTFWLV